MKKVPVQFLLLAAAVLCPDTAGADANPVEGETIKAPETMEVNQSAAQADVQRVSQDASDRAQAAGDSQVSEGTETLEQGEKRQDEALMAKGALQILQGLLGRLAATQLAHQGGEAGQRAGALTSLNGANLDHRADTTNRGNSPPASIDLRSGNLGRAMNRLQSVYGLRAEDALRALQSGESPQQILASVPRNTPPLSMVNRAGNGAAPVVSSGISNKWEKSGENPASERLTENLLRVAPNGGSQEVSPKNLTPVELKILRAAGKGYLQGESARGWGTVWTAEAGSPEGPTRQKITASHVPNQDGNNFPLKEVPASAAKDTQEVKFPAGDPRFHSPKHDLAISNSPVIGTGLSLVRSGTAPQPGQDFTLFGYPELGYRGRAVVMPCTYVGIHLGFNEGSYVLDCPTNNQFLGGMSGGPMVDNGGNAWGVISTHACATEVDASGSEKCVAYGRYIYVTPVSQRGDGLVYPGLESGFRSSTCFCKNWPIQKSCTMTPMGWDPPCRP